MTSSMTRAPSTNPATGESTIGMTMLFTMPFQSTVPSMPKTVAQRVEPTRPPMRAWDDEEGRPKYQVMRFQQIAPTTPAKTTPSAARPVGSETTPLPTVLATLAPRWAPMKLPIAAMPSAMRGVRARVETLVAMAFAASWKPLV